MNASLSHDLVRVSVFEAILASTEEWPYHISMRAIAVLERVEKRMPKLFSFVSANADIHLKPFMDLVASLPRLPSTNNAPASKRDIEDWVIETAFEAHRALPSEEYQVCVQTLMRRIFCFGKDDLAMLDVGFYGALMAFVRPMRDTITHHNLTH